jgi:hypothetical protein
MLSEKTFKEGLAEMEIAFDNFIITEEKARVWYKYCSYLKDNDFRKKIKNCIRGCRRTPTLADIIDFRGYYVDEKLEGDLLAQKQEKEWERYKGIEKIPVRSEKTKIMTYRILKNVIPKYKEKLKEVKLESEG